MVSCDEEISMEDAARLGILEDELAFRPVAGVTSEYFSETEIIESIEIQQAYLESGMRFRLSKVIGSDEDVRLFITRKQGAIEHEGEFVPDGDRKHVVPAIWETALGNNIPLRKIRHEIVYTFPHPLIFDDGKMVEYLQLTVDTFSHDGSIRIEIEFNQFFDSLKRLLTPEEKARIIASVPFLGEVIPKSENNFNVFRKLNNLL